MQIKTFKTKFSILKKIGLNFKLYSFKIKKNHFLFINKVNKYIIENKKYLKQINSFYFTIKNYKNYRNQFGYPVRGQRTHTNAKTKKKFKFIP